MTTRTYHGSCHCGAVAFEAELDLTEVLQCNCSICAKKGALHRRVPKNRFRLLRGEDDLQLYQFNKNIARHRCCRNCDIHAFGNPHAERDQVLVNVRCIVPLLRGTKRFRRVRRAVQRQIHRWTQLGAALHRSTARRAET